MMNGANLGQQTTNLALIDDAYNSSVTFFFFVVVVVMDPNQSRINVLTMVG